MFFWGGTSCTFVCLKSPLVQENAKEHFGIKVNVLPRRIRRGLDEVFNKLKVEHMAARGDAGCFDSVIKYIAETIVTRPLTPEPASDGEEEEDNEGEEEEEEEEEGSQRSEVEAATAAEAPSREPEADVDATSSSCAGTSSSCDATSSSCAGTYSF